MHSVAEAVVEGKVAGSQSLNLRSDVSRCPLLSSPAARKLLESA
jgi:hypothetical protein